MLPQKVVSCLGPKRGFKCELGEVDFHGGPNVYSPVRSHARSYVLFSVALQQREVEMGKLVLERYHVCPFVLRERLDGDKDSSRPIYRYVFSCPGEAAALVSLVRSDLILGWISIYCL